MKEDVPRIARGRKGFRGVSFAYVSEDELMTSWPWDSEADWNMALAAFGPVLQEYVIPNLAGPPERAGGESVLCVTA